jgi:hypothetical protein
LLTCSVYQEKRTFFAFLILGIYYFSINFLNNTFEHLPCSTTKTVLQSLSALHSPSKPSTRTLDARLAKFLAPLAYVTHQFTSKDVSFTSPRQNVMSVAITTLKPTELANSSPALTTNAALSSISVANAKNVPQASSSILPIKNVLTLRSQGVSKEMLIHA